MFSISEMVQWVQVLAVNPEILNFIPMTHKVGRAYSFQVHCDFQMHVCMHIHK